MVSPGYKEEINKYAKMSIQMQRFPGFIMNIHCLLDTDIFFFFFLIAVIQQYQPTDATTNPSLLLAAAKIEKYHHLIDDAVKYGKANGR